MSPITTALRRERARNNPLCGHPAHMTGGRAGAAGITSQETAADGRVPVSTAWISVAVYSPKCEKSDLPSPEMPAALIWFRRERVQFFDHDQPVDSRCKPG
jgi:hypothetical protein